MAEANVLILTYNCGREAVKPAVFAHHIQSMVENKNLPDHELLILSLQEIAPMPYGFIGGRLLTSYYQKLNESIKKAFDDKYVNVYTQNIGITAIMVYARRERKDNIGSIDSGATGVGWQEMGNKGAIGVRLGWLTSPGKYVDLTFIAAHLAPHEPAVERRNQDWMHIVQRLVFQPVWTADARLQAIQDEDTTADASETQPLLAKDQAPKNMAKDSTIYTPMSYVFLAGDLNYRVSNNRPTAEDHAKFPKLSGDSQLIEDLLDGDQLRAEQKAGRTLHGFREEHIDFEPTYKYSDKAQLAVGHIEDNGKYKRPDEPVSNLNYATHRWPSWCDRIMYFAPLVEPLGEQAKVTTNMYTSLPLMSTSDHQPVVGSFKLALYQPLDITDKRVADADQYWNHVPYLVDPTWEERYKAARRREFAWGVGAYLGLTWEGNSILLATALSALGGYFLARGRL